MKPEEIVRQALIVEMTKNLGFPKQLISVEREISTLPHLQGKKIPKRRFDIICFASSVEKDLPLYPLLLVECKAIALSESALAQVFGYNYYVKAHFIALANREGVVLVDRKGEMVRNGLLPYKELICLAMAAGKKSLSSA